MEQAINHPQILPVGVESKTSPGQPDEALVNAVLAGDDAAFTVLFERYRRLVAHLVGRFFQQRDEIEEIVQQSFTKVFFSMKDFRGEREKSLSAWLSKITINLCYDELRRRRRRPENRFADLSEEENEMLTRVALAEVRDAESFLINRDLAEKLLSKLDASDRIAVTLFYTEDRSIKEVAELVGWSPSNVKTRLLRARNYLRKVLGTS